MIVKTRQRLFEDAIIAILSWSSAHKFKRPLFACSVALGLWGLGGARAAADEMPSLQDIAKSCENQERALKSFYVKYRATARMIGAPEDVVKYLRVVTLTDEVQTYAFKGNKRYYGVERSKSSADVSVQLSSIAKPDEPLRTAANSIVAFDGQTLRRRGPGGQTATVGVPADQLDDTGHFNPEYMGLTYRTLPDVLDVKNTRAENRLSGALSLGLCRLRPAMEEVDGVPCVVVEVKSSLSMAFWCDPAKGYVVRKQVGHHPDSPLLCWSATCSDFVEVCEGTWFPKRATNEKFADASAPNALHNVPILAYETEVLEMHANDVPDDLFVLAIPAGT